ncbi:MAG: hypothetical protein QM820_17255 [Minicystis sp.]
MSAPRLAVCAVAAFFASGISIDPTLRATDRAPRPRPAIAPDRAAPAGAHESIAAADTPAPADVTVEVTADARGGHRVVVTRKGWFVSLRHDDARAAGEDWAAMHLAARPGTKGDIHDRSIWEATRPSTLETTRGLVQLAVTGGAMKATIASARAPEPAGAWKSKRATCAAHHDGLGGFTVLCRFEKVVRHLGVANVTGARTLDDAWMTAGPSPMVRLDLPYRAGGAEGRVIGFSVANTAVVLRAEASFPEGEAATLLLEESDRAQPQAPAF